MTDGTRLDGQVAIVTGAAQGIGKGIALVLAEAGAAIVIGDLQDAAATVREIRSRGGRAVSLVMDISISENAKALVGLALKEFGRLDILVNNAALDGPLGNAWDLPDEEWRRTIDVNLSGAFYCSKAALGPMLKAGKGAIINIASRSGHLGSMGLSPAYSASKAGIIGLTMSFAVHLADKGIRVNVISPGLVESRDFGWSKEHRAQRALEYPMGFGQPRDIGEAVRYLASPAARWITGTELYIHGGADRSSPQ